MKQLNKTTYQFEHWSKIAPTYAQAVQKRLDELKASRPFYNWREGQIDDNHLRETKEKLKGMKTVTKKGIVTIEVQLGHKWKGKSVEYVRKYYTEGEIGLGAYEMATILLINPAILKSNNDLFIDCPGDEWSYNDGDFSECPYFSFGDGEAEFRSYGVSSASGYFGSASGFVPQVNLEPGNLEPFDSLPLNLENFILKIKQVIKKYEQ